MLWLYGIGGGVLGFLFGQMIIFNLLKDTPAEEIKKNKRLKINYGLLNWAFAVAGAFIGVLFLPSLFS